MLKTTKKFNFTKKHLRSIAVFLSAIILAISGWAAFKISNFPFYFCLQNFFVIFFAAIWGATSGCAVTGLVLIAGVLGAPIFAHGGHGLEYLKGISGGFLIGYFFAAMLTGYMVGKSNIEEKVPFNKIFSACLGGFLLIYVFGIYHFMAVKGLKFNSTFFKMLDLIGIKWYFLGDAIKLVICSISAYFLRPICTKYFYDENELQ